MLSASKIVNQEALDSQIYNPTTQPSVLMLQQIMETTPPQPVSATQLNPPAPLIDPVTVDAQLQDHIRTFLSLPTRHDFNGVIVNPALCHIVDVRQDLQDLYDYLDYQYGPGSSDRVISEGGGGGGFGWGGGTDPVTPNGSNGNWTTYQPELSQAIQDVNQDMDSIQDHTDRLTSNLPTLAGLAQAALALSTIMNLLSNPCLGLDGLLGSIMDSGKKLIQDVKDKIAKAVADAKAWVSKEIGPLIDQVKGAIADAKAKIAELVAKAKAEIMNFAKAIQAQIRQGLAELLSNLPQDPCLRGLLQSAVTGGAAALIK